MLTHDFTSTTVQEEPETASLPTYPQQPVATLVSCPQQRDAEMAVTPPLPGANCDPWPAVTDAAAILAKQPSVHNVTGPCNDMIGRLSTPAGSVCSDCGQTICSTCQQCHYCCDIDLPCAATLRRRIAQALVAIDPQNTDNGGTGWVVIRPKRPDDDGDYAYSPALFPSFPGKPRAGGAAAVQPAKPLQEVLTW